MSDCQLFSDPNTCIKCNSLFKLVSGRCFEATFISGCAVYGPENNCLECTPGLILENNGTNCTTLNEEETATYLEESCHTY